MERTDTDMQAQINRRNFLKTAAVGAAAMSLPTASTALASSPQDVTTVEFWNPSGDALGGPLIKKIVAAFNNGVGKQDGIYIDSRFVSTSNNSIKYTTGMTSSNSPDLIMTYSYNTVLQWAANGFIQPMDAYLQQLGLKESDFYPVAWGMLHVNGRTWGLMQEFDADLLYWNTDIHKGPPPSSIDELDHLAAKYTKYDSSGKLVQAGIVPWAQGGFLGNSGASGYGDFAPIWGASFYDEDKGKWTINTPQNRRFLDWYLKYVKLYGGRAKADALISATPKTYGYADIFNYGKTAFSMEGEWFPLELTATTSKKLHWAVSSTLLSAPGVSTRKMSMIAGANLFLLPTRSKHVDAAITFAKHLSSVDSLVTWALPIGQFLPLKKAETDSRILKAQPWMKHFNEALDKQAFVTQPLSPQFPVFDEAMGTAVDEVTYMKKTPSQALDGVAQKVATAVSQFKVAHPNWSRE
jgi:ABC-type glycerol-3-phosphate transport system substrate-binding protein